MRAMLEDVRVLDLGAYITAPFATMILAQMGADTIKVERPPGGDPFRRFSNEALSSLFQAHNRFKRSVMIDYGRPEGLALFERLVQSADVLVANSRPGVAEKLGIGAERLRALNPRLIYCAITGFGRDGPYAQRPAFDHVGQVLSGWSSRHRRDDGEARVLGPCLADPVTGMYAATGVLAALHERARTGRGALVEVNMLEAMVAFTMEPITRYHVTGKEVPLYERASMSQSYTLTCRDGKRVGLHASSVQKFWEAACHAVGREEWIARYPARMDRVIHYETIARDLQAIFATRDRPEWLEILDRAGIPFAPEHEVQDLAEDPQVRHLDIFYDTEHPVFGTMKMARRPVWVDGERDVPNLPPPDLGEHTEAVLRELGLSAAMIAEGRRAGVL